MSLKLRSAATSDLLLLSATAERLLGLLGKEAGQAGVLEPKDMPAALEVLKNLREPDADVSQHQQTEDQDDRPQAFQDEPISLRKRAWPLIKMIEEAQAAGKPIVWGV